MDTSRVDGVRALQHRGTPSRAVQRVEDHADDLRLVVVGAHRLQQGFGHGLLGLDHRFAQRRWVRRLGAFCTATEWRLFLAAGQCAATASCGRRCRGGALRSFSRANGCKRVQGRTLQTKKLITAEASGL